MASTEDSNCEEETGTDVPTFMKKLLSESSDLHLQSKKFEDELITLENEIKELISKYARHENTLDILRQTNEYNHENVGSVIKSYKNANEERLAVNSRYEMVSEKISYFESFSAKTKMRNKVGTIDAV